VVARQEQAVFIQGDNLGNNGPVYADGIIPQANLLGKVTRIERNGKKVWLGLGPERRVIAWLSRTMLLTSFYNHLAVLLKLISRR
jgi:hypothetical protein